MTSIIKVDNLQNQCGANIISESANVITIGASGDTVTLAAGASQSGFGRSGSVNWDTTKKTTGFTAVSGNGYFCDTTSAAFTVTLPLSPSAGAIVAIADYNGTALTNNITVGRNSSNINGSASNLTINANYSAVTLVYVDSTTGWRSVDSSNPNDVTTLPEYVAATGGTVTCCGNYKIHTFTGPGTFTVTSAGNAIGSNSVDYLVVAGGGAGGVTGGGGGAGGFRQSFPNPATGGFPITVTGYPITVGAGGIGNNTNCTPGGPGNLSTFSTITSTGGGGGGGFNAAGANGASGGGGATKDAASARLAGGTGNTPPVSPPQGNSGGTGGGPSPARAGGGGGGAGAIGSNATSNTGGTGGTGTATTITGTPTTYAGGGGGFGNSSGSSGGTGGGGTGATGGTAGTAGTTNTGGGGGGSGCGVTGAAGGSGIVIIRYKFQ